MGVADDAPDPSSKVEKPTAPFPISIRPYRAHHRPRTLPALHPLPAQASAISPLCKVGGLWYDEKWVLAPRR